MFRWDCLAGARKFGGDEIWGLRYSCFHCSGAVSFLVYVVQRSTVESKMLTLFFSTDLMASFYFYTI